MEDIKLEAVYRKYRRLVLNQAYSIIQDADLAQDICQDVFVKLSSDRLRFTPTEDQMRNYLCIVTKHRCLDLLRKVNVRREIPFDAVEYESAMENNMEHEVCIKEFASEMMNALKAHNEEWYEILLRLDVYDEKQEIVARDMGISYGLLRTKYHRAKKWIKANFATEYKNLKWF